MLTPLNEYVIIRRDPKETESEGGIVLPENAQNTTNAGEVVAVGPGRLLDNGDRITSQVGVGSRVLFPKHAGQDIGPDGENLIVVKEDELYAIA